MSKKPDPRQMTLAEKQWEARQAEVVEQTLLGHTCRRCYFAGQLANKTWFCNHPQARPGEGDRSPGGCLRWEKAHGYTDEEWDAEGRFVLERSMPTRRGG